MKSILFVFTKHFPYGSAEQYLVDELPYLSAAFDKVVLIPAEIFDSSRLVQRPVPENCEILSLNEEGAKIQTRKRFGEFFSVFVTEWLRCRNKKWFWKERKRYASVLFHQSHLATVFAGFLKERYVGYQPSFYAYWIHNSSIMLGLMKRRGDISAFVCRGHSIDLYEWDWVLTRYVSILPFYHFIIQAAAHIYSISKHGADHLRQRFPSMAGKFSFSRLGVNYIGLNPFRPGEKFTLVSCSNFSDNKRVAQIAAAVALMKSPVRWIHFGEGKGREKTEEIIRNFPAHCTAELRGYTANEKIKEFYGAETVNLVINLSEAEGIPVSLMEAISFGIPVMATAVYGNPEVANEKTGFSVPFTASHVSIAELIDNFAADTKRQENIRSSAHNFYLEHFNAAVNYPAFARELIQQR